MTSLVPRPPSPTPILLSLCSQMPPPMLGGLAGHVTNGHFSERELPLSINTKETLAIWYSLHSFTQFLAGKFVLIQSDNMTAVSYVSKIGGMQSELRNKISRDLWNFAVSMGSFFSIGSCKKLSKTRLQLW